MSIRSPCAADTVAFLLSFAVFAACALYALAADPNVTLVLDLDLKPPEPSTAQVFWSQGQTTREEDSFRFGVRVGLDTYRVSIPVDLRALRIDPMERAGAADIRRIVLQTYGLPIHRWGGGRGFSGWEPVNQLVKFEEHDGVLRLESIGPDPWMEFHGLGALRAERDALLRWVSLGAALVAALVHTGLIRWARSPRRRLESTAPAVPAASAERRRSVPIARLALVVLSSVLSGGLGYVAYHRFIATPLTPPAPFAVAEYELTIVDQWGRRLTERQGTLKLMLDPFTLYRNFPNQRTPRFTIDDNGFRGGIPDRSVPHAVILGGSAAFGMGLTSDDQTFTAQLNARDPGHRFVNAAVVGFLSGQELAQMVHYTDRLKPKLYIVFDGWNEEYVQLYPTQTAREFGYNSWMFETLGDRLFQYYAAQLPPGSPGLEPLSARPAWDPVRNQERILAAYVDNLERMAEFARGRGADVLVVFQPHLGTKRRLTDNERRVWDAWRAAHRGTHDHFVEQYDALIARARAFCEAHRIAYLDLNQSPRFREPPDALYLDTVHLNAEGHRIVAELVGERVSGRLR